VAFLKGYIMSFITVQAPATVLAPRAASWAAAVCSSLISRFQSAGASQAERSLMLAKQRDARTVRQYAQRFAEHDPRFAADLLAAADRHESNE
jgi:hypothetical protein